MTLEESIQLLIQFQEDGRKFYTQQINEALTILIEHSINTIA